MTLALLATLLPASHAVRAGSLEKLLMPGEVSKAHADLEEQCASCHDRSDRTRQTSLCLACHKDIAADVKARGGFHGRLPNISTGECKACHSEHLGRDANIVRLVASSFDHGGTDFKLEGAHVALGCEACHAAGKPYRAAPGTCGECHRRDDVHQGGLGANCASCHATVSWRNARFDHGKTRFPLRAAHQQVSCAACHIAGKFRGTPLRCSDCHTPDDVHAGSRGNDCAQCHVESGWKNSRFDHARETGFALEGAHAALDCAGCHRSGKFEDELPRKCVGCHRSADAHATRFGDDCGSCHRSEAWKPANFDHTARAQFALSGVHAKLDCHACHTARVGAPKLPTDCASCHRGDDVHAGALAACDSCHSAESWRQDVQFDHDLTDFPLLGMHVLVGCGQCHASRSFAGAPGDCIACHRSSDRHQGSLGKDCAACHSPNGWKLWEFDHDKQTHFPLTGRHASLTCGECHRKPGGTMKLPSDCASCHRDDDLHLGQFGTQCQRCHTTITFQGARIQ
jgi:hypothetical protein